MLKSERRLFMAVRFWTALLLWPFWSGFPHTARGLAQFKTLAPASEIILQ
jgi:hypothetical protein